MFSSAIPLATFVIGFICAWLFLSPSPANCSFSVESYTNPELDCINTDEVFSNIHNTELKVKEYIDSAIASKKAKRVSVFFRDLKTRRWFGVNHTDNFSPGSLLKLPLAIAFYKLAEIDPSVLSKNLVYTPSTDSLNNLEFFRKAEPLNTGVAYPVADLIERMIKDSDNEVLPTLFSAMHPMYYEKVLGDLGVRIPLPSEGGIHARFFSSYTNSAILRSLYNSSYLNLTGSRAILEILAKSSFDEGLTLGIPNEVKVSHKFGEAVGVDPVTNKVVRIELHDCGIVYRPDNPYIICVMTEGLDFKDLSEVVGSVSEIVWSNNL